MSAWLKTVFEQKVCDLNLNEFPCGNGKWRNDVRWVSDLTESKKYSDDASLFTNEELLQLCEEDPYARDIDWSSEAKGIVGKVIDNPLGVSAEGFCDRFKQLRLVNGNISHVGTFLKHFSNLEELVLSVNHIKNFDANVLPLSLNVLELCGNEIDSIDGFTHGDLQLRHLGLGHNFISSINNYSKGWESLLSLDLSFNQLTDLEGTISAITRVPTLRVLCLQGNPFSLFMGYRGLLVDFLPHLSALDDVEIFADERHRCSGMSRLKNIPWNYSAVKIVFNSFDDPGISDDQDPQQINDQYPKTSHYYQISLNFVDQFYIADDKVTPDNSDTNVDTENCISNLLTFDNSDCRITTNEFEYSCERKEDMQSNKYIICKHSNQLLNLLLNDVPVKLIKSVVVTSNEPKPMTMPSPSRLGISKSKKTVSSTSLNAEASRKSALNASDAKKSTSNVDGKKSAAKIAEKEKKEKEKDKKSKDKKPVEPELYIWSRDVSQYGSSSLNCRSLLQSCDSSSTVEGCCVLVRGKEEKGENDGINIDIPSIALEQPLTQQCDVAPDTLLHDTPQTDITSETTKEDACADPSVHFRIEIVRWNNFSEAEEWMKRFRTVE